MLNDDDFVDEPGPSVHLNPGVADTLLKARGWTPDERPCWRGTWIAPDGHPHRYGRDEALRLALTAEAVAVNTAELVDSKTASA